MADDKKFNQKEFTEKIGAAKLWVGINLPYLADAVFRARVVPNFSLPTMAIDNSWRIYANPTFVQENTTIRVAVALVHEVHHPLMEHSKRAITTMIPNDHQTWNIAGDCEINDGLADAGLDVDHENWMYPSKFGFDNGDLAEKYYRKLREQANEEGGGNGEGTGNGQNGEGTGKGNGEGDSGHAGGLGHGDCGSGAGGRPVEGELPADGTDGGVSETEAEILRRKIAQNVEEYEASHGRGTVPAGLSEWAANILRPKVDWRKALGYAVRQAIAYRMGDTESTYRRLARRNPTTLLLPGRQDPQISLAAVWDTSASVSDAECQRIASELEGILRTVNLSDEQMSLLTVSTHVASVERISNLRNKTFTVDRGGTDMRVGIEAAVALNPRPNIILVMTDGETPWPDEAVQGVTIIAGILTRNGEMSSYWTPPDFIKVVPIPTEEDGD